MNAGTATDQWFTLNYNTTDNALETLTQANMCLSLNYFIIWFICFVSFRMIDIMMRTNPMHDQGQISLEYYKQQLNMNSRTKLRLSAAQVLTT